MKQFLRPEMKILEFGCGTGYMVTYPLRLEGFRVEGIDNDEASIRYGAKELPEIAAATSDRSLEKVADRFDAIIASEVLEHLADRELPAALREIRDHLRPGGLLLVTVPNGRGWFEVEKGIWDRLRLDAWFKRLNLYVWIARAKRLLFGDCSDVDHPATLSPSPHLQQFSLTGIQRILAEGGFEVTAATGSVLMCGPLSHVLFTGIVPWMRLNVWLGRTFPRIASGFYVACRSKSS